MKKLIYIVCFFSLAVCQSYKVSGERLYNSKVESIVAIVDSEDGIGSGIVISEDGHVITNYHVIEGLSSEDLFFYFHDNIQNFDDLLENSLYFEGEIIYTDKSKDLALLKVDTSQDNIYPIKFADPNSILVGSQVFAIGHPDYMLWSFTEGIINRIAREEWSYAVGGLSGWWAGEDDYTVNANTIFTQTPINAGNSGGLLMNSEGEMIGVNTWSDESMMNVSGAINIDEIIAFIRKSGIHIDSIRPTKRNTDINESAVFNLKEVEYDNGDEGFMYYTYFNGNKISVELGVPKIEDNATFIAIDLNLDDIRDVHLYDIDDDESFSYWEIDINLDGYIDWKGDTTTDKKKKKYRKFINEIDALLIENFSDLEDQGFFE